MSKLGRISRRSVIGGIPAAIVVAGSSTTAAASSLGGAATLSLGTITGVDHSTGEADLLLDDGRTVRGRIDGFPEGWDLLVGDRVTYRSADAIVGPFVDTRTERVEISTEAVTIDGQTFTRPDGVQAVTPPSVSGNTAFLTVRRDGVAPRVIALYQGN